jgi:hypothetical protein
MDPDEMFSVVLDRWLEAEKGVSNLTKSLNQALAQIQANAIAAKIETAAKWRLLEVEEQLRDGDEYFVAKKGRWARFIDPTGKVSPSNVPIRRLI